MTLNELRAATDILEGALTVPWHGEPNLIGTQVHQQIVKIAGAAAHIDEAILACVREIRKASEPRAVFEKMWKTIRDDKTIDIWHYNYEQPWRSLSIEIQFQTMFSDETLYMVVTAFVPFGAGDDSTHYPTAQDTAVIRDTQELRAVVTMHAKRLVRGSSQDVNSCDRTELTTDSEEVVNRQSNTRNITLNNRTTHTSGESKEEGHLQRHWPVPPQPANESHTNVRRTNGSESVTEVRGEASWSQGIERIRSEQRRRESSRRVGTTLTDEDALERTEEVGFVAIGSDYSQPERMWEIWRRTCGNKTMAMTLALVVSGFPTLGRIIERELSQRRLHARGQHRAITDRDFWTEVQRSIARHEPNVYGSRVQLEPSGQLHAIEPEHIARTIQRARQGLGQLTGRSHLLEGQ